MSRARERRRWKSGTPTPRMLKKRAGYFEHLRKQRAMQTGEQEKFNIAVDPGCGGADVDEIILLDNVTGMPED